MAETNEPVGKDNYAAHIIEQLKGHRYQAQLRHADAEIVHLDQAIAHLRAIDEMFLDKVS